MKEYAEKIKKIFQGEKGLRLIVILGLTGMALILFSSFPSKKESQKQQNKTAVFSADNSPAADQYRISMEKRLTELLSKMDGIGKAEVMITLSGSAEQIYAEEVRSSKSDHSDQKEATYVITKSGGNESALVSETRYPAVIGAVILCSSGDRAVIREKVSRAVSTALGIPASSVFVGKSGTY